MTTDNHEAWIDPQEVCDALNAYNDGKGFDSRTDWYYMGHNGLVLSRNQSLGATNLPLYAARALVQGWRAQEELANQIGLTTVEELFKNEARAERDMLASEREMVCYWLSPANDETLLDAAKRYHDNTHRMVQDLQSEVATLTAEIEAEMKARCDACEKGIPAERQFNNNESGKPWWVHRWAPDATHPCAVGDMQERRYQRKLAAEGE